MFLYEWSKFRYGVFEEHGYPGDPLYPMFYSKQIFTTDGMKTVTKPNFCTNTEPSGSMEDMNGDSCTPDEDDCVFIVDGPSSLVSSVMGVPYLSGNDQWCDDSEEKYHQSDIPTKHNTMCDARSVFNVVKQSQDFVDFQPLNNEVDTSPTFTILQPNTDSKSNSFVFILDYSGSMDNNGRLERMKQGIQRFMDIDVDLADELPFGVVTFAEDSRIDQDVIPINTQAAKDKITQAVDQKTRSGTCLWKGVRDGLSALSRSGLQSGGTAIFLTDGEHNCSPDWLPVIIDEVLAQDVRFCTIAMSNSADQNLEEIARQTNGASSFVPDSTGPDYLNNALTNCLDFLPSQPSSEKEVNLFQKTYSSVNLVSESFIVDQFSGKNLNMQIDYELSGSFTIRTNLSNVEDQLISGTGSVKIDAPEDTVQAGVYSIDIIPTGGASISHLTILVKSKAPENVAPVLTNCWTSSGQEDVDLNGNNPDKLVIYGQATQGSSPVIDANIKAFISAGTDEDELELKDDGVAPDSIKNDGIYSAYYIAAASSDGVRYSLTCKVGGDENTRVVNMTRQSERGYFRGKALPSHPSSSTPLCCGSQAVKVNPQIVSLKILADYSLPSALFGESDA